MEFLLGLLIGLIVCFWIMVLLTNRLLDNYVKRGYIQRKDKIYHIVEMD